MGAKTGQPEAAIPSANDDGGAPDAMPGHRWFSKVAIVLALLLTVLAATLIYTRWYHARMPNSYVIPFIPETSQATLGGAEVVVSSRGLEVARVRLNEANGFTAPVLVESDVIYSVTVRHGDQVLMRDQQVAVPYRRSVHIPIATQPAGGERRGE